jgi:SAM-dependent methyltransferase
MATGGDPATASEEYARRLEGTARWKKVLDVQAPYRWNLRRKDLGRTLDVGCGVGRNLEHLPAGSVGVDHNELSVRFARERGLDARTSAEWAAAPEPLGSFDSVLVAHVVEHMPPGESRAVVASYLPYLRSGGRVLFICPQERGYASDATHVAWTTGEDLARLARDLGLDPEQPRSFPLPRAVGRLFTYNEFNLLARKP